MKAKSDAPLPTPRIDEVLTQFRQRGGKPTAENQENEQRIQKLEQQVSHLIQKVKKVKIDYYISVIINFIINDHYFIKIAQSKIYEIALF